MQTKINNHQWQTMKSSKLKLGNYLAYLNLVCGTFTAFFLVYHLVLDCCRCHWWCIASVLTRTRKNHFTESLIELNITGTLPEEIDEISTVSEFEAIKPTFYQGIANFFFILNQNIPHTRARKHDENVCFYFQVFHQMLSWEAGDFEKWYSRPWTWYGIRIGTEWRHFRWLLKRGKR